MDKQSPGGPWQSQANGSNLFVYFYVQDMKFFKFETNKLVEALEEIIKTIPYTDVKNSTYITRGYRVPRTLLKDLAEEHAIELKVKDNGNN